MKAIVAVGMCLLALFSMSLTVYAADEVTGQFPDIDETLACDIGCTDAFEAKCTQAARFLDLGLTDTGCDDPLFATIVAYTPVSMLGQAVTADGFNLCSDFVFLTRPTATEGTMKALITVFSPGTFPGPRDYNVQIGCYSNNIGGYRTTTQLNLKQDQ